MSVFPASDFGLYCVAFKVLGSRFANFKGLGLKVSGFLRFGVEMPQCVRIPSCWGFGLQVSWQGFQGFRVGGVGFMCRVYSSGV